MKQSLFSQAAGILQEAAMSDGQRRAIFAKMRGNVAQARKVLARTPSALPRFIRKDITQRANDEINQRFGSSYGYQYNHDKNAELRHKVTNDMHWLSQSRFGKAASTRGSSTRADLAVALKNFRKSSEAISTGPEQGYYGFGIKIKTGSGKRYQISKFSASTDGDPERLTVRSLRRRGKFQYKS